MSFIKGIFVSIFVFALGCSYSHFTYNTKNAEKEYDINSAFKSVVKIGMDIKIKGGQQGTLSGTAWAIDKDHLITASHVCIAFIDIKDKNAGQDIKITYLDSAFKTHEKIADIKILFSDVANDVCLMEYRNHGLVPLKLASGVRFGEKVYVVGAPVGFIGFVFDGRVVNRSIDLGPTMRNKTIISAAATGGVSGGPVLNSRGEVIGILIAGLTTFDHFSICTGLDVLKSVSMLLK